MSLKQVLSLIVSLQSVFGQRHEVFLSNDWTFVGAVDRLCTEELQCDGDIPACDSSTNGATVQDRNDHNGCVAQGCESGSQFTLNTYYCDYDAIRHEAFLSNDWTFVGTVDRLCTEELLCGGDIPACDSSTDGTTVQDRNDHNGCVAQGCESGSQFTLNTYYCDYEPSEDCGAVDIDGFLEHCSDLWEEETSAIDALQTTISAISGDVESNEEGIAVNAKNITAIKAALESLQNDDIQNINAQITALQTEMDDKFDAISNPVFGAQAVDGRLDAFVNNANDFLGLSQNALLVMSLGTNFIFVMMGCSMMCLLKKRNGYDSYSKVAFDPNHEVENENL